MRRDGCGGRNFCGAGVERQCPLRRQSCLLRVSCMSPFVCVCVCMCVLGRVGAWRAEDTGVTRKMCLGIIIASLAAQGLRFFF